MRKDYEKLFSRLESLEPPAGLRGRIFSRIDEERRLRTAGEKAVAFGFVFALSLVLLVAASINLRGAAVRSGFLQLFSLLVSDLSLVWVNAADFAASLLEALPVFATVLVLGSIFLALWSWSHLFKETRDGRKDFRVA